MAPGSRGLGLWTNSVKKERFKTHAEQKQQLMIAVVPQVSTSDPVTAPAPMDPSGSRCPTFSLSTPEEKPAGYRASRCATASHPNAPGRGRHRHKKTPCFHISPELHLNPRSDNTDLFSFIVQIDLFFFYFFFFSID